MSNIDEIKKQQKKIELAFQIKILKHIINHFELDKKEVLNTFFYSDEFENYMKKYKLVIKRQFGPHIVFQNVGKSRIQNVEFSVLKMMIRKTNTYELKRRVTTTSDRAKSLTYYHVDSIG